MRAILENCCFHFSLGLIVVLRTQTERIEIAACFSINVLEDLVVAAPDSGIEGSPQEQTMARACILGDRLFSMV